VEKANGVMAKHSNEAGKAAEKIKEGVLETLSYYDFPSAIGGGSGPITLWRGF